MTAGQKFVRLLPSLALVVAAVAAFATLAANVIGNGRLSVEESIQIVRALWYGSGAVKPFSAADAGSTMPLYSYLLGLWQSAAGADVARARYLSVGLTLLDAALLFAVSRRLTANTQVAAAAVFIFLVTPAAAYFHLLAAPIAAVTFFHLLAIFLIVQGLGRPRVGVTIAFALTLAVLVLFDRDMLAAVLFLGPLYVVAIGKQRFLHLLLAMIVFCAVMGGAYVQFGERWLDALRWGPLLAPAWMEAGIPPPRAALIELNTVQGTGVIYSLPPDLGGVIVDSIVLPYGAAILTALLLFVTAGRGLRVLWAVPIYVLWLIGSRLLGPLAGCDDCLIRGAGADMGVIALGCALTLAMAYRSARQKGLTASVIIIGGALLITVANTFGPALASRPERQYFPAPMLRYPGAAPEKIEMRAVEQFIAKNSPGREPVLILHAVPGMPAAATLAGRRIPAQSLNPMPAYRTIKSSVPDRQREATLAAIEGAGLWTDETLKRWLERDYDVVIVENELRGLDRAKIDPALSTAFERIAEISVAGRQFVLYRRKA